MNFAETLKKLRTRACKSRYRLAKYSGVNQAYILRLESEARGNPSRDIVLMLGLALVEGSDSVAIWDRERDYLDTLGVFVQLGRQQIPHRQAQFQ